MASKFMQALAHITPFVPLMGLFGTAIVATGTVTYLLTNRMAENELKVEKRDREREVKEAAAELERVRSLADLELKVERASIANTSLVVDYLFRGDFSPMREALQAKQAAASAARELAAAPVDQVLK